MQTILMPLNVEKTSTNPDKKQALLNSFGFLNADLKRRVKNCPHFLNSYTTNDLQVICSPMDMFQTISSLLASFCFIPIINDFMLFILFTMLFRFLTHIADTFSGS